MKLFATSALSQTMPASRLFARRGIVGLDLLLRARVSSTLPPTSQLMTSPRCNISIDFEPLDDTVHSENEEPLYSTTRQATQELLPLSALYVTPTSQSPILNVQEAFTPTKNYYERFPDGETSLGLMPNPDLESHLRALKLYRSESDSDWELQRHANELRQKAGSFWDDLRRSQESPIMVKEVQPLTDEDFFKKEATTAKETGLLPDEHLFRKEPTIMVEAFKPMEETYIIKAANSSPESDTISLEELSDPVARFRVAYRQGGGDMQKVQERLAELDRVVSAKNTPTKPTFSLPEEKW